MALTVGAVMRHLLIQLMRSIIFFFCLWHVTCSSVTLAGVTIALFGWVMLNLRLPRTLVSNAMLQSLTSPFHNNGLFKSSTSVTQSEVFFLGSEQSLARCSFLEQLKNMVCFGVASAVPCADALLCPLGVLLSYSHSYTPILVLVLLFMRPSSGSLFVWFLLLLSANTDSVLSNNFCKNSCMGPLVISFTSC